MGSSTPAHGLPFGSFGYALYDPETETWHFQRNDGLSSVLSGLIAPPSVRRPSITINAPFANDATKPTTVVPSKQQHALARSHIGISAAKLPLAQFSKVSEAVTRAQNHRDHNQGALLVQGSIPCESSRRQLPILAHATGSSGSDLRLVCLMNVKRGWDDNNRHVWLNVAVPLADEVIWTGDGCPIQQVCFMRTTARHASPVALRYHKRTVIFRPVLRRAASAELDGARLDPNPICEIPIEFTGGAMHADVAFNPWNTKQLAIIDQAGSCTVWQLESRDAPRPKLMCTIHTMANSRRAESLNIIADGWGRVRWMSDLATLILCTRQEAVAFNIENGEAVKLCTFWDAASAQAGMLMDVATLPGRPEHLTIVDATSVQIIKLDQHTKGGSRVRRMLSFHHYLDSASADLRLCTCNDGDGYLLFVYSQTNPTIVVYRCIFNQGQNTFVLSAPSDLDMSPGRTADFISKGRYDLILAPAEFMRRSELDSNRTTSSWYGNPFLRFFDLFELNAERKLCHNIITVAPSSLTRNTIPPLTWEKRHVTSAAKAPRESFVVADGTEDGFRAENRFRQEPVSVFHQKLALQQKSRSGMSWTVHYEGSVRSLQQSATTDIGSLIRRASDMLEPSNVDRSSTLPTITTLRELSEEEMATEDIEAPENAFRELQTVRHQSTSVQAPPDLDEQVQLVLQSVKEPAEVATISIPERKGLGLSSTYDKIVADMISPLPSDVAGRVRLAKEQLARRVAVEVTLASYALRPPPIEERPAIDLAQPPSETQEWEIPVRSGRLGTIFAERDSDVQPIAALPTPSATPSVATAASSHPSSLATPDISRLTHYAKFSEPLPLAFPRSINRVLSHWTPGEDAAAYDWVDTSRRLTRQTEAEDADSQLTARERARLQRRAERHIRRQRREAAASQAQQLASSQLPALTITSTQPTARSESQQPRSQGHATTTVEATQQSSQPIDLRAQIASQLVPGRFAERAPRKKKRKQGF